MKCIACNKKLHRRKGIRINKYYYCQECINIINVEKPGLYKLPFTVELIKGKVIVKICE